MTIEALEEPPDIDEVVRIHGPDRVRWVDQPFHPLDVTAPQSFARGDELELARALADQHLGPHVVYDQGELRWYVEPCGAWLAIDDSRIARMVATFEGATIACGKDSEGNQKYKPLKLSATFAKGVHTWTRNLHAKPGFFDDRPHASGFQNGVLFSDGSFAEKGPDNRLLESDVLPFDYEPVQSEEEIAARCPKWLAFLRSIWRDDADRDDKILVLHQFLGRVILGTVTDFAKAILLYGETAANGKSTLLRIVSDMFPPRALASVAIQDMSQEFANESLATARLNYVADMSGRDMLDAADFKKIVAGDRMRFCQKYRQPYTARPRAGHIFACNTLPAVTDRTDGVWRRWIVLGFHRSFQHDPDKDVGIAERIIAAELPGIVAACVFYGLALGTAPYTEPHTVAKTLKEWREGSDNTLAFTRHFEKTDLNAYAYPTMDLYRAYKAFCVDRGTRPVSEMKFSKQLARQGWERVRTLGRRSWLMKPDHEVGPLLPPS